MAVTQGYVQRLSWSSGAPLACVWVGSAPDSAELLTLLIQQSDPDDVVAVKRSTVNAFVNAQITGRAVAVTHPDDSAEVSSVGTVASDVVQNPLQMDGLEITQSIQNLSQSVPLVAGKRTVVRLYLSYYASPGVSVRGEITLRRGPNDPPVTVPSANTVALDPAQAGNVPGQRNDAARSLNFVLPDTHTAEGALSVNIASITDATTGNPIAVGSECRPTVWFHASPPMRVRVLGLRYAQGNPPVTFTPTTFDFQALNSWLGRAYPVGQVVSSSAVVDATATAPFGCGDTNAQIAAIRALDMGAGGDHRTHYYGLVSDGGFFMRGCTAGIPTTTPDPSTVASGPTGPASWGWDFDGSYCDWYGGHELGHMFGRLHPGFCGETQDDLTRYPYANGQLAGSDASFGGFDVGDPALNLPMVALPGMQWHDVMTYCNFQWLSAYTYQAIRQRLLAEDALGAGAAMPTGGAGAAGAGPAGAGGRPDERFPERRQALRRAAAEGPGETLVSVVANVNLTANRGRIQFVNPVEQGRVSPPEEGSPVVLRVKRADGTVLHEHPAQVKFSSELLPTDDRTGLVDAVLAVEPGAQVIELVIAGEVVDTFDAGGPPPRPRAVRTIAADGNALRVAADVDRPAEPSHTYAVQVSTDGGTTWQTVGVGLKEPVFTLDRSLFRAGDEVRVRVIATNGFTSSVVTSETFRI